MSRQNAAKGVADAKKVSGELFTLTYGALVAQLLKDYEADEEVNRQLERMGYNIGVRLIEDLLARSSIGRCHDFRETADVIAKQGFKTFLGISPQVVGWNAAGDEFSLVIENNPLAEFVELPEGHNNLWYSSILIGVIKGALEMTEKPTYVIGNVFVNDVGAWGLQQNSNVFSPVKIVVPPAGLPYPVRQLFSRISRAYLTLIVIEVQMEIEAAFVQDILKGDPTTELRVKFIRKLEDAVPAGEE
eukprot:gene17542-9168_t